MKTAPFSHPRPDESGSESRLPKPSLRDGRKAGSGSKQGFTLIELLVVITIIAILAALVLNTAGYVQRKAAMQRAEGEVSALSTALESYKAEYGDYPISTNVGSNGSIILYNALVVSNAGLNPSGKVFFEPTKGITATSNMTSTNNYFMDPFGTSYNYTYPGDPNRSGSNFFDLWSLGGKAIGSDPIFWVKNW